MTSDVLTLPTKPAVDAAWVKHSTLQNKLQREPALQHDESFMAECQSAEASFLNLYRSWAERGAKAA